MLNKNLIMTFAVLPKNTLAISSVCESSAETPHITLAKQMPVQNNHTDLLIEHRGITCPCCLSTSLPHNKCVLFIRENYNIHITHVVQILQKVCAKKQKKQLICKSCHMMLKGKKI